MSCTDPNPRTVTAQARAARDARRAAEQEASAAEDARQEVARLAGSLAHDAYYATHDPLPGVILLSRGERVLSPRAAPLAHGIWDGHIRTHLCGAVHAYVCLDCRWVGAFDGEGVDREAQRAAHACDDMARR